MICNSKNNNDMRQLTIFLVAIMQLVCISAYSVTPVKTKDSYYGKKVTLYPLDNGYYKIDGLTVGNTNYDLASGKLYYADYGDQDGVFIGVEVTLKDGRHDYIYYAIADYWVKEKDENQKGVVNFVCGDEDTCAEVYAIYKGEQGVIIVSGNTSILIKYAPSSLVRVNPVSALETIFNLDAK